MCVKAAFARSCREITYPPSWDGPFSVTSVRVAPSFLQLTCSEDHPLSQCLWSHTSNGLRYTGINQTAPSFNLLYSSQCNRKCHLMSPIFVHIQQKKYTCDILPSL